MITTVFMHRHPKRFNGSKEPQRFFLVNAPIEEAKAVFQELTGYAPDQSTCSCCGSDFYIIEREDIQKVWTEQSFVTVLDPVKAL